MRVIERLVCEPTGLGLVEDHERWVDPRRERVRAQQPGAEAVDRRDERRFGGARELVGAQLSQPHADAVIPLPAIGSQLRPAGVYPPDEPDDESAEA